jgi:glutathione S-transferase
LLGKDPLTRAEVRRLISWFDRKFNAEVTEFLVSEKALKRLQGRGEPDSLRIRSGCVNIRGHLDYIVWLAERRNWLAGEQISLADLAAGAHLSLVDYMGDVPWNDHPLAKEWYARLKSRPGFRGLLGDHIAGFPPPRHYADLDF